MPEESTVAVTPQVTVEPLPPHVQAVSEILLEAEAMSHEDAMQILDALRSTC